MRALVKNLLCSLVLLDSVRGSGTNYKEDGLEVELEKREFADQPKRGEGVDLEDNQSEDEIGHGTAGAIVYAENRSANEAGGPVRCAGSPLLLLHNMLLDKVSR